MCDRSSILANWRSRNGAQSPLPSAQLTMEALVQIAESMCASGQKQTIPQPRANLLEMSMQLLWRQINPTFENDTYVVLPSPSEVAFANCEKVVERDVEIYRKKSQSI